MWPRSCFAPEGAVEPHRDRPRVHDRGPERLDGLARERPARGVGDGPGDDQRDAVAGRVVGGLDAEDRRLRIERVEDRLDDEQVRAARDEALGRLLVRLRELVERHVAGARILGLRGDRGGPVRRAEGAHDVARPARIGGFGEIGGLSGETRGLVVHLAHDVDQPVVGLGDARGGERVGLDDVRAGIEIGAVDREHDVRPDEREQVAVTAQVVRVVLEPLGPVVRLLEAVALDERAHRAVHDDDPLAQQVGQAGKASRPGERRDRRGRARGTRGGGSGWIGGDARDAAPCSRTGSVPAVVRTVSRARCVVGRGADRTAAR